MPRHVPIVSDDVVFDGLSDAIARLHEAQYRLYPIVRLGASEIGNDCHRDLWLSFRWASKLRPPKGQRIRIFKRGDREEDRIIEDMRGVGWNIFDRDETTGKQYEYTYARGHGVVRLDGAANDPHSRFASSNTWFVLEAKSHNNKNFVALQRHGLSKAHPKHFAQIQIGAHCSGIKNGLYAARNKDNEEDRFIRVEYDEAAAIGAIKKTELIVESTDAPTRISIDADYFRCKMCSNREVCHGLALPERNCRSCAMVAVLDDGKWGCTKFRSTLTLDEQKKGCPSHRWNPSLISGEPTLKHEAMEWVQYKLQDGSTLVDNGLSS